MGAATFMMYNRQKARQAALRAKQAKLKADKAVSKEDKVKAAADANQAAIEAEFLAEEATRFGGGNKPKKDEPPSEVTDKTVHFQNETALDLDGDGKADVIVKPVKK